MTEILIALDFSPHAEEVLEAGARMGAALEAKMTILHVAAPDPDFVGLDAGPQSVRDSRAGELRDEHRRLEEWARDLTERGLDASPLMVQGATADTILHEASKRSVEMIVLGSHAKGALARAFLGSVSRRVVERAPCPVLVVPAGGDDEPR